MAQKFIALNELEDDEDQGSEGYQDDEHQEGSSLENNKNGSATSSIPAKRCRSKNKDYELYKRFKSREEAEMAIAEMKIWSTLNSHVMKKGKKIMYRCNLALSSGPQCSAAMYLFLPNDKSYSEIFMTRCAHDHNARQLGVCLETRAVIRELLKTDISMKPNAILLKLARINEENASRPNFVPLKIPQLKDLYNFLQIQRREMQENPTDADLNLSDLSNLTSPPQTQLSFPVSSTSQPQANEFPAITPDLIMPSISMPDPDPNSEAPPWFQKFQANYVNQMQLLLQGMHEIAQGLQDVVGEMHDLKGDLSGFRQEFANFKSQYYAIPKNNNNRTYTPT